MPHPSISCPSPFTIGKLGAPPPSEMAHWSWAERRILDGRPLMTVSVSLRFAKGEGEGFDIVKLVEEVDLGVRDGHSLVEYFHAPPNIGSAGVR